MLERADVLQTISEIGAAFAGFAALVSAIGRRTGRDAVDATRLHVAVAGALIAALGGLVPFVVAGFVSGSLVWRISAAVVLAVNYAYPAMYAAWLRRLRRGLNEPGATRLAFWCLEAAVQIPFFVCILGFGDGPTLFLVGLIALLGQAAFVFLGLVTSLAESAIAGRDEGDSRS